LAHEATTRNFANYNLAQELTFRTLNNLSPMITTRALQTLQIMHPLPSSYRALSVLRTDTTSVQLFSRILPSSSPHHLLVLHGLLGRHTNWLPICRTLSFQRLFQVHLIDMRNHGHSDHHPSMRYGEMADDVLRYADRIGLHEFSFLGHSMGGRTAMHIAADCPDRVTSLALVGVSPCGASTEDRYRTHILSTLERMRKFTLLSQTTSRTKAVRDLYEEFQQDRTVALLMEQNLDLGCPTLRWECNTKAIFDNVGTIFGSAEVKGAYPKHGRVLIVAGEKSQIYGADEYLNVFPRLEKTSMVVVPGAGHWVHAEKPRETRRALLRFFRGVYPDMQ
ncbi:MAG: alpha/beta fold hydrolase, partial [Puia sp.]|nr:alpha/beta fold hydrolase [Puia sp.]